MTIRAAGGILWRDATRREFAVVHRRRYGDWCLPKGKIEAGETLEVAAGREVFEETGWQVDLGDKAGELVYEVGGTPKRVVFWNMTPKAGAVQHATDPEEVESVEWFELADGLARLSHAGEQRIVSDNARR